MRKWLLNKLLGWYIVQGENNRREEFYDALWHKYREEFYEDNDITLYSCVGDEVADAFNREQEAIQLKEKARRLGFY